MTLKPESAVILIPSLEPDDRLPAYMRRLLAAGFTRAVVVNDGSSKKYQPIFDELAAMDGVTVLRHEVNRGKGCALKTGYTYIRDNIPEASGVITADADGQHTVEDCWKLAEALTADRRVLYLGSRDFDLPNVPPKSRFGNKTTSWVFRIFYGHWLPDTQTGLRAFKREDLQFMIDVPGERFEYEMQVLIACARAKMDMVPITIETVYENENEGTHFHPIRDSYRIYKVILGSFVKFMGASIASWVIDYAAFSLLDYVLLPLVMASGDLRATIAYIIARCISAPCNFLMNRNLVFKFKENTGRSAFRYALLALFIMAAGAGAVWVLKLLGLPSFLDWLAKLVVDCLLYLVSYRVQDKWVFAPAAHDKEAAK
ncbi:MAG: bifunctional glycosyltransferase family 2/GtrA family protein [Clostridia bacterium]|nr:bifunctional glycosyltransferase family 2/GtrA family protein [Clostridia bacterium]